MERTSSNGVMRLGPLARRLLGRRRRWLRWAAIVLAALTILSAAAQLRHRPAPRRTGTPAGRLQGPAPAPRFYGVAGQVPPGMRAVNLIVPAAATFAGRLVPLSHVDVLAAFDMGQDRMVRSVLTSGIVLRVTGASSLPSLEARFATAPVAELSIAVPAAREREVVMAQAFGRMFVAVEPVAPGAPAGGAAMLGSRECAPATTPDAGGSLSLRRYLGLPALPGPSPSSTIPAFIPAPPAALPASGYPWPAGAAPRLPPGPGSARGSARPSGARDGRLTVEVIEGTLKSLAEVTP